MQHPNTYVLFHTQSCHLCEQAKALLDMLGIAYGLQDICDDVALVERYGERIPVLLRHRDRAELGWPFDAQQLQQFTGV